MNSRTEGGFTLLETVVGLAVMIMMITAVVGLFVSNLQTLALGKARAIGTQLANEQMENLRNMPYDDLATKTGDIYPPGNIDDTATVVRGNYTFLVHTRISYVDDPYDGNAAGTIAGKPVDTNPADYKKAKIWINLKSSGALVAQITSDFAGKAAETASNTGIICINVNDSNGQPVASADVSIQNPTPNPDVNITTSTDTLGRVCIPNLPPDSSNHYQIIATKAGYSTDKTLPDPAGTQTAVQLNLNVLVQKITNLTLSIDRLSNLNVHVVDTSGAVVANKAITVVGAKKIYANPDVFKYSNSTTTDAGGNFTLSQIEWDSYSFVPPSGYYLVNTIPYAPVGLAAATTQDVTLVLSTSSSYPTIKTATPVQGATGASNLKMSITGSNLASSSSVLLRKSGQADIAATGETYSSGILTATFNLSGAATGAWDLVVSNGGTSAVQTGGFNVTP